MKKLSLFDEEKPSSIVVPAESKNTLLPEMLSMAVPLWIMKFQDLTDEERRDRLKELDMDGSDLCFRMEYLFHKKPGETAKAFNDLAKAIALMSFCPGGVTTFGQHYEAKQKRERIRL